MKEWHILFDSFSGIKSKVLRGITWLFAYALDFCFFTSVLISQLCFIDCRAILSSRHIHHVHNARKSFLTFSAQSSLLLSKHLLWSEKKRNRQISGCQKKFAKLEKTFVMLQEGDNVYHASDMT